MCVCMCVCVYVCVYVCVCVCVRIYLRNSFSFLFSDCLCSWFSGLQRILATSILSSRRFFILSELFDLLAVFYFFTRLLTSSSQEMDLFEILNLLHRCIDSCWGFKALPTKSNYCGCPRSLLLYGCTTRRVNKETTIKVYSSTVKINERFGTAIAIWVFSIGSYSSTTGFIVICHS